MSNQPVMRLPETAELPDLDSGQPLRLHHSPKTNVGPVPWRLRLQLSGETHTTLGLDLKPSLLIGRSGPHTPPPDLDLSPYGGDTQGVSRRHAQLLFDGESLFLEDLNSTNGTRLNGYILKAGEPYRLRDGDEITLGSLRILLRFIKSPKMD
jgi:pSer/pThr/pTyr-binding forkhead associated (FHA) protein